jgi:hypothetical protein
VVANCAAWATLVPSTSFSLTAGYTPAALKAASVARPNGATAGLAMAILLTPGSASAVSPLASRSSLEPGGSQATSLPKA